MSKRIDNKRGHQRVSPARSRSKIGWRKKQKLNELSEMREELEANEKPEDDSIRTLAKIKSAINRILPGRKQIKQTQRRGS